MQALGQRLGLGQGSFARETAEQATLRIGGNSVSPDMSPLSDSWVIMVPSAGIWRFWFWLSGSQRYCGQCAAINFDNFWRSLSPHIKLWTYWQIGNSSTSQVHILYRTFPCCILPFLGEDSPYPKMRPHSVTSKKSFLREPIRLKRDDLTICIRIIGQNAKPSQRKQPLQYSSTW